MRSKSRYSNISYASSARSLLDFVRIRSGGASQSPTFFLSSFHFLTGGVHFHNVIQTSRVHSIKLVRHVQRHLFDNGHVFEDRLLNGFSGLEQSAELFPLRVLNFGPTEELSAFRSLKGDLLRNGVTKGQKENGFQQWNDYESR